MESIRYNFESKNSSLVDMVEPVVTMFAYLFTFLNFDQMRILLFLLLIRHLFFNREIRTFLHESTGCGTH